MATQVKERPIVLRDWEVQGILKFGKTQLRRVVRRPPSGLSSQAKMCRRGVPYPDLFCWVDGNPDDIETWGVVGDPFRCPYGNPGDRLWVKENAEHISSCGYDAPGATHKLRYKAGGEREFARPNTWPYNFLMARSAACMPRWASRLSLEIAEVRVEKLQAITPEDLTAEGFPPDTSPPHDGTRLTLHGRRLVFAEHWDAHNKAENEWDRNPDVWAITFRPGPFYL